jgi:phosphatidylserine decarboxylase
MWLLYSLLVIILFLVFFYRYPLKIKVIQNNYNTVLAPAYGKIMKINNRYHDNTLYIAIFLSPLDIHYQFYPVSGTITDIKYDATGNFNLAYEYNKSNSNEKSIITINNPNGNFIIYQIAGFIVRRITYFSKINKNIDSGQCLGLIHFGSRVDIIIPNANKFSLQVKEGQYVNGPNSILGTFD